MDSLDFATIVALTALLIGARKGHRIWRAVRFPGSSGWPTFPATTEQAILHTYSGRSGDKTYRFELVYSYEVNGDWYSGCYEGDPCSSLTDVQAVIDGYPKGTTLQVHVNPRKPEQSVFNL